MIRVKEFLAAAALVMAGGCNYSQNDEMSAENPKFGSATDIASEDGRTTNSFNEADNGLGGPMQRASGNYQSQPLTGQRADVELAKKIKVALTTGSMGTTGVIAENQLTEIDVAVHDGVVTLRGPVASEQEKETLEKQVAGMTGVRSVRNELTVGGRHVQDNIDPLVPRGPGNQ